MIGLIFILSPAIILINPAVGKVAGARVGLKSWESVSGALALRAVNGLDSGVKRQCWIPLIAAAVLLPVGARSAGDVAATTEASASSMVFVGTYTSGTSKGIHAYRFDGRSGAVEALGLVAEMHNPSWLEIHPNGRFLYAASEVGEFRGKKSGAVYAFAIDRSGGTLSYLNSAASGGASPCHLTVDHGGEALFVANYGGGSTAMLPIDKSGKVGELEVLLQHEGSSLNQRRQNAPHAHGVSLSADNRFLFVPDLGTDKIMAYYFDAARGTLQAHDLPFAAVKPGAGPRHFAFHPNQEYAYSINELDSTITTFYYLADRGALSFRSSVSTLPSGFSGHSTTAEIVVHPSGRFLYGSNRGHDSIAVYRIGRDGAQLQLEQHVPTGGGTPRSFGIDPTGEWLWVANQSADGIVLFRVDPKTGRLSPSGTVLEVGAPVCVKFLAIEG